MIKIEKTETFGWESAIRGMRNPMNSWEKSDSFCCVENLPIFGECEDCPLNQGEEPHNYCIRKQIGASHVIGKNDLDLARRLAKGGAVHAKYRRMIVVTCDITAPLYWWKEFDTYKVGTVANSCSTMHKIHAKEFALDDFSCEHLLTGSMFQLHRTVDLLNEAREEFLKTKDKMYWWQMIQLLPSSYNQKRTVMLNYEVLMAMYRDRKNHKLDEWREFCKWVEKLPYSELITGEV